MDKIVRAFNRARDLPRARAGVVIAGSGPEENALRVLAGPDVLFMAFSIASARCPACTRAPTSSLLLAHRNAGTRGAQAMASGLPVIATPAGGVADHLRDGVNGIAYPRSTSMRWRMRSSLTLDVQHRRRLADGARQTAMALDWEVELDRLDASYRGVLSRAANPATHSRDGVDIFPDVDPSVNVIPSAAMDLASR